MLKNARETIFYQHISLYNNKNNSEWKEESKEDDKQNKNKRKNNLPHLHAAVSWCWKEWERERRRGRERSLAYPFPFPFPPSLLSSPVACVRGSSCLSSTYWLYILCLLSAGERKGGGGGGRGRGKGEGEGQVRDALSVLLVAFKFVNIFFIVWSSGFCILFIFTYFFFLLFVKECGKVVKKEGSLGLCGVLWFGEWGGFRKSGMGTLG